MRPEEHPMTYDGSLGRSGFEVEWSKEHGGYVVMDRRVPEKPAIVAGPYAKQWQANIMRGRAADHLVKRKNSP
jgi:hypothetical protein